MLGLLNTKLTATGDQYQQSYAEFIFLLIKLIFEVKLFNVNCDQHQFDHLYLFGFFRNGNFDKQYSRVCYSFEKLHFTIPR